MIRVTDTAGDCGDVLVENHSEIVEHIRGWFPDAPAEVQETLMQLETLLRSGGTYNEQIALTEALGISITTE